MAKVIFNDKINGVRAKLGDFVYEEENGWGIVGWGGEENKECVYYLNGGYDTLSSVHIKKVLDNENVAVIIELIKS